MRVCNCSMFCCTLLYVHSSIAIILMGKRELVALLNLSSLCLVMVDWHFLAVSWSCLRFVIVVFPDHTHLRFFTRQGFENACWIARHAEPGKFDIKRRQPGILFISLQFGTSLKNSDYDVIIEFFCQIQRHWRRHLKSATPWWPDKDTCCVIGNVYQVNVQQYS